MTDDEARAMLHRFGQFADQFACCFGRRVQADAASQYLRGLLNDSPRKSMQAMHGRLSAPPAYQALQHFITDSPWPTAALWARLRAVLPDRQGILAVDDTSFPKQGTQSVGVKRQYCGALGKTANCQVAVSTALIGAQVVWPTSCELYLPADWTADADRREKARIPATVRFREKWRMAVVHIRAVRKAGFTIHAVVADADYGSTTAFRTALEREGLRYAVAVRGHVLHAWPPGAPRTSSLATIGRTLPATAWRRVRWGQGTKGPLVARFAALRLRLRGARGERWVLFERAADERKYYVLNLDATASLKALVRLARSRWPIEQQYRELKDELGLDHFEGRTYPGWSHHTVLTAVAFTFLQQERRRSPVQPRPTLPAVRAWMREIAAILYFVGNDHLFNLALSFRRNPPLRI